MKLSIIQTLFTATLLSFGILPAAAGASPSGDSREEKSAISGELVYQKNCSGCHNPGIAGAPKTGDKRAWQGHIAHGIEHLVENAIKGVGNMPPRGGHPNLSDAEIRAAVDYIVEQSR